MMIPLRVKGKPLNITETLVGRVTRSTNNLDEHSIFLSTGGNLPEMARQNILAIITTEPNKDFPGSKPVIHSVPDMSHLVEGDIISLDGSGNIYTLYRADSEYNSILVTERCNNKCLMCSQPPKLKNDIQYLFNLNKKLFRLIPKSCKFLGITGGEPSLLGDKLFELLTEAQKELPQTDIHILTNGRRFSKWEYIQKLSALNCEHISFGIPLYSDYFALHDYIVQSKSAFSQTVTGLYNLARLNQRVEIRIVLHNLTIKRLVKLAKFIYKNLPFVEHVAFMGMENIGLAPQNMAQLWIDPHDYMDELTEAVMYLDSFRIPVSIYNLQLCIMPEILRKFSRNAISDWKNAYIDECYECEEKDNCGGFFESCKELHSNYIKHISPGHDG